MTSMNGLYEQVKGMFPLVQPVKKSRKRFCAMCVSSDDSPGECSLCHLSNLLISVICDHYSESGVQHLQSMAREVKDEIRRRNDVQVVVTGKSSQSLDPRVLVKMMEATASQSPSPVNAVQFMEKDDGDVTTPIRIPRLSIQNIKTQAVKSAVDEEIPITTDIKTLSTEEYYDSLVKETWIVDAQEYHKLSNEPLAKQFQMKLTHISTATSTELDQTLNSAVVMDALLQQHTHYIHMMKARAVYLHCQQFIKKFPFQQIQGKEQWHQKMSQLCPKISRTTRYSLLSLGELCDTAPNLVYLANAQHRLIVSQHTTEVLHAMKRYRETQPTDFRLKWQDPPLASMLLLSK